MTDRKRRRSKPRDPNNTTAGTVTISMTNGVKSINSNQPNSASSVTASLSVVEVVSPDERKKRSRKVRKVFDSWIRSTLEKGVHGLATDYLKTEKLVSAADVTAFKANNVHGRNRSAEVSCLDATRVILKYDSTATDYIHANYIETAQQPRRFIITQAPLDQTAVDFWRMIQGEKVDTIVMLCDFYEHNRSKSAIYFPREKGQRVQFQNFEISNLEVKTIEGLDAGTQIRVSRLKLSSTAGITMLQHYHWAQWSDRKAPRDIRAVLRLLREVRSSRAPIVVHCSTGIGRSATFVAIEMILEQLIKGENSSTETMLNDLRKQRAYAITTDVQYVFIYRAVLQYLEGRKPFRGDTEKQAKKFYDDYEHFLRSTEHLNVHKPIQMISSRLFPLLFGLFGTLVLANPPEDLERITHKQEVKEYEKQCDFSPTDRPFQCLKLYTDETFTFKYVMEIDGKCHEQNITFTPNFFYHANPLDYKPLYSNDFEGLAIVFNLSPTIDVVQFLNLDSPVLYSKQMADTKQICASNTRVNFRKLNCTHERKVRDGIPVQVLVYGNASADFKIRPGKCSWDEVSEDAVIVDYDYVYLNGQLSNLKPSFVLYPMMLFALYVTSKVLVCV
ncbi:hypothetical protein M3Y94_01044200 [Aphelenchoides besseyi]|nr:hypothetical protein M3Y94_01044200 [Aphelenchoides besseyi]